MNDSLSYSERQLQLQRMTASATVNDSFSYSERQLQLQREKDIESVALVYVHSRKRLTLSCLWVLAGESLDLV